jgi:hypothetical protein
MRVVFSLAALMFSFSSAASSDPGVNGYRRLKAFEIKRAFVGKTFSDDVHFAFHYIADGRIQGTGMGTKISSRWRINKDELCVTDTQGENCYAVWKKGREVKLIIGDQDLSLDGSLN